ncbi:hypothetical protein VP1G_09779 [Cytospora mali]|uniref:Fe2OG dioxygenase domain-containing protein n=1 Tax=Cytospora mali TaxID=578113 RepID=A0A194VFK8_CYTMA|nr:hypothetical protein VP1G_09779 [Valsa mali var. pyri (nom. inval.)]
MSNLLPINPADFPDVPTKKAFIAIDLQNDFLAEDGALPVSQPDGMVDNIVKLAAAVRNSGYGEVVWVRSQFDTNRAVGEQQIITADTPQLPEGSDTPPTAATSARARTSRASPPELTPLEADPEAFLSTVSSDQPGSGETKPQCVRKGTKGVELLPAIAAAKGPTDYAMTKTYYSAFQSGQLLHLLRRHFATELYICGALCNVSVYATALAASSYGFDITIVEDCCGIRSEMRHMNARRKLTELTGCEFATAADIIPTLKPKSPSSAERSRPSTTLRMDSPAQIPPEVIAAMTAGGRQSPSRGGQGISSTGPANVSVASHEKPQPGPAQSQAESAVQSVVKTSRGKAEDKQSQPRANAQGHESGPDSGQMQLKDMMAAIEASRHESQPTYKTPVHKVQKEAPKSTVINKAVPSSASSGLAGATPTNSKMLDAKLITDFVPTEELLMAKTPDHISKGDWPVVLRKPESPVTRSAKLTAHRTEKPEGVAAQESTEDASKMAKDSTIKPTTSEPLCEGDTTLASPLLPTSILSGLFERLCTEVHFLKMMHQGGEVPRFVAVQGSVSSDGTQPVYRHPSDETLPCVPFTPAVQAIKKEVEKQVGHEMNHVLIQCYRGGNDYISEHSDKTLDIVKGSYIANVSLGAERTMVFRTKRDASSKEGTTPRTPSEAAEKRDDSPKDGEEEMSLKPSTTETNSPTKRQTIRVPMPHNSLLQMGLSTNAKWLHGIRPDKRPLSQRSPKELAFNGYRISLTFRHIGTFLSPPADPDGEPLIWGQGAVAKTREHAQPVVNGQTEQAIAMLKAFGWENNSSEFDWGESYGRGFDVLHMKSAPRYFSCGDTMVDGRVRIALAELCVKYARGSIGTSKNTTKNDPSSKNNSVGEAVIPVKFVVDDADRTTVTGDIAILLYLDARYPRKKGTEADIARLYTRFHAAIALGHRWKSLWPRAGAGKTAAEKRDLIKTLVRDDMGIFNTWLYESLERIGGGSSSGEGGSGTGELFLVGGAEPSIADYAFWPVMYDIAEEWKRADGGIEELWVEREKYTTLKKYYVDFSRRRSVVSIFGEGAGALGSEGKKQGGDGKEKVEGDRRDEEAGGKQLRKPAGNGKGEI